MNVAMDVITARGMPTQFVEKCTRPLNVRARLGLSRQVHHFLAIARTRMNVQATLTIAHQGQPVSILLDHICAVSVTAFCSISKILCLPI